MDEQRLQERNSEINGYKESLVEILAKSDDEPSEVISKDFEAIVTIFKEITNSSIIARLGGQAIDKVS